MTYKEVIGQLMSNTEGDYINSDDLEAFKVAISALEKQIPKKATEETINRGIDITGEYDIDCNLCCPGCGAVVGTFETGENEYFAKYCGECGQALDWSDAE